MELWHLERLLPIRPNDALLYLRRARLQTAAGDWQLARRDIQQAFQLDSRETILAHLERDLLISCRKQDERAALRYLCELLVASPVKSQLDEDAGQQHIRAELLEYVRQNLQLSLSEEEISKLCSGSTCLKCKVK